MQNSKNQDMEFFNDCVAVGVDLILLGFCVREYVNCKRTLQLLRTAPQYNIDGQLKSLVEKQPGGKVPYAVIRGMVTPIGDPRPTQYSKVPSANGFHQIVKLHEHRIIRGITGLWRKNHILLHESAKNMPFELRNQQNGVQIVDALGTSFWDVDMVYDNFERSSLSIFDRICGFFSGVPQRGFQTTEELLRDGGFLTAIGELKLDGNTLRMQPSQKGPLLLTTASKFTIVKRLEKANGENILKLFVCGTISVLLIAFIASKIYKRNKKKIEESKIHNSLERERNLVRPVSLKQDQLCVVCGTNAKEIILLPCGHVCLCENCSQMISITCPVCRCNIESKAAAFIA
ncbi:mitochondrial E3 ubiquitin protein ligase 1-like isoform X2 [Drosophila gunungcola]|uniref:mitochondrial E3 ubiquitin protein ligase 1-like isoform X2 n=1 Tax=Drosophila gunungcola TaxID=103775 RepID=UPI0022E24DB9|nr:mitochondrial E3 ubiquitin protein ligase 1-like isoform X2 [Drosophila gunungcola]